MTTSRVVWFIVGFIFAVPAMLMVFRDSAGTTRNTWLMSVIFAASIATIVAISFGKGKQ